MGDDVKEVLKWGCTGAFKAIVRTWNLFEVRLETTEELCDEWPNPVFTLKG